MKKLNLNAIRIDGGTQARVEIDMDVVADYAEAVKAGIDFPLITVYHDGADYWLADGFHRFHAHKQAGKASIAAEVLSGTVREAILHSLGANGTHGLRRSNADKRKAVQTLLADAEWADWSDRKIAEVCGVGHPMVAALRRPEVAEKQQQNRVASASKAAPKVESDSTPKPEKQAKRTLNQPESAPDHGDELAEAQNTITDLAAENERLADRLAVEAMDASEDEKTAASQTIAELRHQVQALEAELSAVKASRDTHMRENNELKSQIKYWRKQAEKATA